MKYDCGLINHMSSDKLLYELNILIGVGDFVIVA